MATYRKVQEDIRNRHDRVMKTCWIADVKASHGLTRGMAPNRQSAATRVHPCPPEWRPIIEDSLRRFGMLE